MAAFRVGSLRYARLKIIREIPTRKITNNMQHVIVHCRMFGESPRPFNATEVIAFLGAILRDVGSQLAQDGDLDVKNILEDSTFASPYKASDARSAKPSASAVH